MTVSSLWVGLFAAMCTCAGIALVRKLPRGERPRELLTLAAAGLLLFILIEVGYQALGTVELDALGDDTGTLALSGVLMIAGLLVGMVGLAWIETRRGEPGALAPQPLDVAVMLAAAIGLHNFAEGLSVGQTMATALTGPGAWVALGLGLHAVADGAAVAAPVAGQPMPPGRVLILLVCAAGPSLLGTFAGTTWVGPGLELLVISLAAGTLIYVLRELLRAPLTQVTAVDAMVALSLGLLAGLGTELIVEVGRSRLEVQGAHAHMLEIGAPSLPTGASRMTIPLQHGHHKAPGVLLVADSSGGQPQGRLRPPLAIPCSRDELTSYTGRVTRITRNTDATRLVIRTDEETIESVTIAHPGAKDASAFFLMGGKAFTDADWPRIEQKRGTLKRGQRATAWVCTNGKSIVDWEVAAQ
jgi:ZIP family zinc transporter